MRNILAVLVENKPGVLTRVAGLFSRRGFNIENIAVGDTMEPGISRMTITVDADAETLEQIVKQLNKLVNVIKISNITNDPSVLRELMLVKVNADIGNRSDIQQIVETFRGKVVDVAPNSMIIEVTGNEEKLEAIKLLLKDFGIREIVRTGTIALVRGSKTTTLDNIDAEERKG
ncbi:MAG: acetolactate synthase small subunit [Dethiobacteria bacterium]|jgi:acetolactate synthase-1/3 small subunit|nr:acetolactate synthase small subunit [Bacillota bacterium]